MTGARTWTARRPAAHSLWRSSNFHAAGLRTGRRSDEQEYTSGEADKAGEGRQSSGPDAPAAQGLAASLVSARFVGLHGGWRLARAGCRASQMAKRRAGVAAHRLRGSRARRDVLDPVAASEPSEE